MTKKSSKLKTLKAKGYIGTNGKADINTLSALSALTTLPLILPLISELREFTFGDKISTISNIYGHLAFLYDEEKYTEAARFIGVVTDISDIVLPDDVKLVLNNDLTKEMYLCEFIEDYYEIVDDYRAEMGYKDSDGDECVAAYGSFALRFRERNFNKTHRGLLQPPVLLYKIIYMEATILDTDETFYNTAMPVLNVAQAVAAAERNKFLNLESRLNNNCIVGQEEAVSAVARAIRRAMAGFRDPNRPICNLLFVGCSGVGKTHLARVLSNELSKHLIKVDCSELSEPHTVSRLLGTPAGFLGFDASGSEFCKQIKQNPNSVVVFDELEKANRALHNILLQVMEVNRRK